MKYLKKFETKNVSEKRKDIIEIMKVINEDDDCSITVKSEWGIDLVYKLTYNETKTGRIFPDKNIWVYYLDSRDMRELSTLDSLPWEFTHAVYEYLSKKYDYILSGKDMGLLEELTLAGYVDRFQMIIDIMRIIKEDECNIKNGNSLFYKIIYYKTLDRVYLCYTYKDEDTRNTLSTFDDTTINKVYKYLIDKYDYVLTGKDNIIIEKTGLDWVFTGKDMGLL